MEAEALFYLRTSPSEHRSIRYGDLVEDATDSIGAEAESHLNENVTDMIGMEAESLPAKATFRNLPH
jgi:hypothetical protein